MKLQTTKILLNLQGTGQHQIHINIQIPHFDLQSERGGIIRWFQIKRIF